MKDTNLYFGYRTDNSEFIISRSEENKYQNIAVIGENVLKSKKFTRQLFRDVKFADDIDIDYTIQNSILNNNFECRIKEIKDEIHKRYVRFSNCKVRNFYEYNEKKQKLIYILKYFIIEDLHKVLNDYNIKDFIDLISYGGGVGFRFVIYVSNADNEVFNSFLFSFHQTKIIFRTDKDIIKKIFNFTDENVRKIDNLKENEYLFNHSSQDEWLLKLSSSKYKNYNLDSLLSLNDVERGNVIFLLSRPCVCKKDIFTIICGNFPKSFIDYCYDLRNIKTNISKELKKLVLTKYVKSAIIDYSQIERYSNKSLIFEELKQLSKGNFNFNIFITYNLPRIFESQKNKLPTLRQINKMTEFKYITCKVIGVGLKEDLETNVYKVYKMK